MEITKAHIDRIHTLLDQGLTKGLGDPVPGMMCVEAAICYALDLPHGDDPGCVAQSIRTLKIGLNDSAWSSNKTRAEGMRRLAIAQLGSKDVLDESLFVTRVARLTVRLIVPAALRAAAAWLPGEQSMALCMAALKCEGDPTAENAHHAARVAYNAARIVDRPSPEAARIANTAGSAASNAASAVAETSYGLSPHRSAASSASAACDAARASSAAANAAYAATRASDAVEEANVSPYDAAKSAARSLRAVPIDELLSKYAESIVEILIGMKAPGCQWLE